MPTLRFHAISEKNLQSVAISLLNDLMNLYQVPADYINIEVIQSKFIVGGELNAGFPLVEVIAFKRPDAIQDAVAKTVYTHLLQAGYPESELYFTYPEPRSYYGNGEHY